MDADLRPYSVPFYPSGGLDWFIHALGLTACSIADAMVRRQHISRFYVHNRLELTTVLM